ncbi:hypothetical protein SPRG_12976 [Saprolegnia parasitica CBS 223.65]|uniref:Uncharacterized protein n=1 Tax=Saprolegnia parasitica (strain CBS 223.65) TaxID=695850 RepID=A0A067BQ57_SAPPC|nr:hypothetical protein SPRG_12976 [Saprolegnia parasitica CBS 223.65]KDO20619.1 hypothetical protein SPRG_12976 [Saprolegnia parasitica CBS 223.65]|eukprot:XP_012208674.1 hypothetical protein SPRG_12976 [Saprolegnia parasitica CBS 223.65]
MAIILGFKSSTISENNEKKTLKGWWRKLVGKTERPKQFPVVPLPAKYANESKQTTVVGGKPVPFLPQQVALMKARVSVDELGSIDELKEGVQPKKAVHDPTTVSTHMVLMMSSAM